MKKITYSKKLYVIAQAKFWGTLIGLIFFLFLDFRYGFNRLNFTEKTFELLFCFISGFFLYPLFQLGEKHLGNFEDKILDDADRAKLGFEGEDIVANWLKQILPANQYTISRNVILPKQNFDIDFIIIGPKGVIVLEAKNYTTQVVFSNDEFFQIKNGQKNILPLDDDPRDQVRRQTYYLRKYFELNGYKNLRILKAVIFVDASRISIDGNTGVYIAGGFDSLKKFLDSVTSDETYTPEFCKVINKVLPV